MSGPPGQGEVGKASSCSCVGLVSLVISGERDPDYVAPMKTTCVAFWAMNRVLPRQVQRFLQSRHPQHRVYNLCKEEHRRQVHQKWLATWWDPRNNKTAGHDVGRFEDVSAIEKCDPFLTKNYYPMNPLEQTTCLLQKQGMPS